MDGESVESTEGDDSRRICDIYDFFAPHINVLTYLLTMRQEREKRVATETKKLGERRVVELDSTIHREGQLSKAKPTGEILSRALPLRRRLLTNFGECVT